MFKKILVPLDGSSQAETALVEVQKLAKLDGSEVVLLQVPMVPNDGLFVHDALTGSKISEEIERESRSYIKAQLLKWSGRGMMISGLTRSGPVAETILEVAREIHADLIAMTTHEHTMWHNFFIGCVTDRVVHRASIPVVVIHPN